MSNQPQHWSQVQEAGALFGIKTLFWIYRLFGRPLLLIVMSPVVLYFFALRPGSRHASLEYLTHLHAFEPQQPRPTLWLSLRHFFSFAECLVDKIAAWSGKITLQDIQITGHQQLIDRLAEGKGGVIIASHLGNLEVCRVLAEANPLLRLTILVHTRHAQKFNQLAKKLDPEGNIALLQVTDFSAATAIMLNDKVMAGEFIAIAGDRTSVGAAQADKNNTPVEFLGDSALFPEGAHLLAGMLRCPLYMMFCLKQQGHYHIYFELLEAMPRIPRKARKEVLQSLAQRYAVRLQHYCLQAPLQWYNFYPFWQQKNPEDNNNE